MAYYKTVMDDTPIGQINIYAQDDYIIKITFGNDENDPFEITPGACYAAMDAMIQLDQYFNGQRKEFSMQIACDATEFEQTVWAELCNINYGQTISYKELAKRCGNENAFRAVAKANKNNPLPIIIPCHRVISSDGTMGGYSGGIEIKKKLLEIEAKNCN